MNTINKFFISTALLFSSLVLMANEEYNTRFNEVVNDSIPLAKEILLEWEQNGPIDGDYYAAQFNYYLNQGVHIGICMAKELPLYVMEQGMTLTDSLGNPAGYMYGGVMAMDTLLLDSAITWLQRGIALFPERLDLRIGLSTTYKMMDDGDKMFATMCETVEWVMKHPKVQCTWTSDDKLGVDDTPIESTIQDYFSDCYYSGFWKHLAEPFVDLGLRYAPKSAIFMNDKAVLLMEKNDVKGALKLMKKALKFNPDDELIKGNVEYIEHQLKGK